MHGKFELCTEEGYEKLKYTSYVKQKIWSRSFMPLETKI